MVEKDGISSVREKFSHVNDENYYSDYSKITERDKTHIEEAAYKTLNDLMNSEIEFVANGGLMV